MLDRRSQKILPTGKIVIRGIEHPAVVGQVRVQGDFETRVDHDPVQPGRLGKLVPYPLLQAVPPLADHSAVLEMKQDIH